MKTAGDNFHIPYNHLVLVAARPSELALGVLQNKLSLKSIRVFLTGLAMSNESSCMLVNVFLSSIPKRSVVRSNNCLINQKLIKFS